MFRILSLAFAIAILPSLVRAAEGAHSFTQSLTPEQRERLGLGGLTPEQLANLDAAVTAYANGQTNSAVAEVKKESAAQVQQAKTEAAAAAVDEYKKKQEPGIIARTLATFKHKEEENRRDRFKAHVVGEFRGWRGGTYFPLENGQVWRQVTDDTYELAPVQNAEVEFYKSTNGYWRMSYGGAWITVKRLQ